MDEDLIIVDDLENDASTSQLQAGGPLKSVAEHNLGTRTTSRLRSGSNTNPNPNAEYVDRAERTTRSTGKGKAAPKLKLKLGEKIASQAPGVSFLGQYDRELDSDDEDLAFEEQFVLRVPPGEDCEKLRKAVASREVGNDVWFKFKDSRRAVVHIGNNLYSAKLVDLPCIIESQKTLDHKQMFKVADICQVAPIFSFRDQRLKYDMQMLVVGEKIPSEDVVTKEKNLNIDDFIWPHGITPPLQHVRKRRFRKRVNRRTIESVEQEVERLLDEDSLASEVKYEVLENVNPDLSDSEFIEHEIPLDAATPAVSDLGDAATPAADGMEEDEGDEEVEEAEEGDIDEELAAELDLALGDEDDEEDEDEDEDEDSSDSDSEDDDDDDDDSQARKLLSEEIRDLEAAVNKRKNEIESSANPLIRLRFEVSLKKLAADLEMKIVQRDELKEKQRLKKEGIDGEAEQDPAVNEEGDADDEDDLFGDSMDIG